MKTGFNVIGDHYILTISADEIHDLYLLFIARLEGSISVKALERILNLSPIKSYVAYMQ